MLDLITAQRQDGLVAALADEVAFAHVTPGGRLDELRRPIGQWGISEVVIGAGCD